MNFIFYNEILKKLNELKLKNYKPIQNEQIFFKKIKYKKKH